MREKALDQPTPIEQPATTSSRSWSTPFTPPENLRITSNPKPSGWGASPLRSVMKFLLPLLCLILASCSGNPSAVYDTTETPERFTTFSVKGSDGKKYEVTFTWERIIAIPGDHEIYCHIKPENTVIPSSEVLFSSGNRRELRNIKNEATEHYDKMIFNYFGVTGPNQQEVFAIELDDDGIPRLKSLRLTIEGSEKVTEINEYIEPDARMLGERISHSYGELIEIFRRRANYMGESKTMNSEPGAVVNASAAAEKPENHLHD